MLAYLEVHFYYLFLPTIALYLLMRPLMSDFDKIKLISISVLTIIYKILWHNYIVYHKALWYRKDAVIDMIGYMPIEEYLFSITQTIFSALWTSFCTRWTLNSLFLKTTSRVQFQLVRFSVIIVLKAIVYTRSIHTIPATKTFYLSSILWWSSLPLIVLWYLCGPYACKRYKSTLISVFVPSIYFCWVNVIVMKARIRHVNEATSLIIFIVDDLPLEEIVFIILTNSLTALSSHTFDKSKAIIDTYCSELIPFGSNVSVTKRLSTYIKMLLDGLLCNEQNLDPSVVSDIETCYTVLHKKSKSYRLAFKFYPNDINQDLTILYAFCRLIDEMVDDESSIKLKTQRLHVVYAFLDQLFSNRKVTSKYCWEVIAPQPKIDWPYFERVLSNEELSAFRSISRIAYYMPQEPFYELMAGYKWDIDGRCVENENDLIEYSKFVAGSPAILTAFVFCHKSNQWPDKMGPKCRKMLENAQKMGAVLQICNISRDIITDSETLGRCYIPKNYLKGDEFRYLVDDRNPHRIPNEQLKRYAEKMLDIGDKMADEAIGLFVNPLPGQCRRAVLSKMEIYLDIGKLIRGNPFYERRANVSISKKILIALQCMYFTSLASLSERGKQKNMKDNKVVSTSGRVEQLLQGLRLQEHLHFYRRK